MWGKMEGARKKFHEGMPQFNDSLTKVKPFGEDFCVIFIFQDRRRGVLQYEHRMSLDSTLVGN